MSCENASGAPWEGYKGQKNAAKKQSAEFG